MNTIEMIQAVCLSNSHRVEQDGDDILKIIAQSGCGSTLWLVKRAATMPWHIKPNGRHVEL